MNLEKEMKRNQILLSLYPSSRYSNYLLKSVKELRNKKVCFVSLNKTAVDLKKSLKVRNISTKNIFFVDAVSQNRGLPADYVRKNAADGQTFYGEKAKEVGLVDTISSFQGVVKLLDSSHNSPQPASQGGI